MGSGGDADRLEQAELRYCAELLKSHGASLRAATDYYIKHVAPFAAVPTIASLVEPYLAHKESQGGSKWTVYSSRSVLSLLIATCGSKRPSEVMADEIRAVAASGGVSSNTRQTRIARIGGFFSWAVRQGHCADNPCRVFEPAKIRWKEPATYSLPQVRALLCNAGNFGLGRYIACSLLAGLRPFEAASLTESAIDLEGRMIVAVGKCGRRTVRISDQLAAWLSFYPKEGPIPKTQVYERLGALHAACRVPTVYDGYRHTCASYLAAHPDFGLAKVSELLGHSKLSTARKHYVAVKRTADAEAFVAIMPPADTAQILMFEPARATR